MNANYNFKTTWKQIKHPIRILISLKDSENIKAFTFYDLLNRKIVLGKERQKQSPRSIL